MSSGTVMSRSSAGPVVSQGPTQSVADPGTGLTGSTRRTTGPASGGSAAISRKGREAGAPAATTLQRTGSTEEAKAQERGQDSAALDRLDAEADHLTARAGAVNSSLDRLKDQQARQGLGLRGDIAARQHSMNSNLSRARDAIDKRDVGRAQKYRDAAESDIEALERFLGR
jgi:ABC-type phosphate transport system auxiliary subunit